MALDLRPRGAIKSKMIMIDFYIWHMAGVTDGEFWSSSFLTSTVPNLEIETIDDVRVRALMMAPMDFELDSLTIYSVYRMIDGSMVNAECVYRISTRNMADTKALVTDEIDFESINEFINYKF